MPDTSFLHPPGLSLCWLCQRQHPVTV